MKLPAKEQIVNTVCNKPVPPAEAVADKQNRSSPGDSAAYKLNIAEMFLQASACTEAEEPNKQGLMSRFYYHFNYGASDMGGLR